MTDHALEQTLRAAYREAVDQEAPTSLRASVIAIPDVVPAMHDRRSYANRRPGLGNRMVPIGLAAAAAIVMVVIGLSLFGQPARNVGDPTPVPDPTQVTTTPPISSSMPPVSSSATGNMTISRMWHQALLLANGRVLVHGGSLSDSSDDARLAEIYDSETGTWTPTASTTMQWPALALLADGRVLAAGGSDGFVPSGDDVNVAAVAFAEIYDPSTETWTVTGSMNEPRMGHTATLLADGRLLIAGGDAPAELYDPTTETWTVTGNTVEARGGHTATLLLDGTVLVAGGYGNTASAELYDPGTGTWRATGDMPQPHAAHTATLLADGKVLVVGGERMGIPDRGLSRDESQRMAADIYDPSTGTWAAAGIMTEPRLYHAAALLPHGRVLVTGGLRNNEDGGPDRLATVEVYDPETGEWSASANLVAPRFGHTATLLPDGRVLLAGGQYDDPEPLPSAEIYNP